MSEPKNKERKFKWHSIYGQILFDRKLMAAWEKVKANGGAGGVDGDTIESFDRNAQERIEALLAKLRAKEYKPSPVKRTDIPKKTGKLRPLGIPTIEDRVVQQAVVNVLEPKFEEEVFHRWSCGYRPERGAKRVNQIILWNIETGYNFIYDADIRGFFDNIPHKQLMRVLNKYVADGTVLDMVWKWLKAGYMEEGKYHDVNSGTPQGGVISPLLANIYLNELDWELEQHGIRFVRYADDFLLFAKTRKEIELAADIAKAKIAELGLEIASEKTKIVDFNDDDFDFLGFTFGHWRKSKEGKDYFLAKPTQSSWKDARQKIKDKTRKTFTLNKEAWIERVNPIIRGKVNYYLNLHKAIEENRSYGLESRCFIPILNDLKAWDGYIRKRLRVAMIHKHPTQRKGWLMCSKWTNAYFAKIGLVPSYLLYRSHVNGMTLQDYLEENRRRSKRTFHNAVKRAKKKGQEYFTPDRVRKMQAAKLLATT